MAKRTLDTEAVETAVCLFNDTVDHLKANDWTPNGEGPTENPWRFWRHPKLTGPYSIWAALRVQHIWDDQDDQPEFFGDSLKSLKAAIKATPTVALRGVSFDKGAQLVEELRNQAIALCDQVERLGSVVKAAQIVCRHFEREDLYVGVVDDLRAELAKIQQKGSKSRAKA